MWAAYKSTKQDTEVNATLSATRHLQDLNLYNQSKTKRKIIFTNFIFLS